MYIISWNINGLASRFSELQKLVDDYTPDFVCLQKVRNNSTREDFEIVGYRQLFTMQDCAKWSGVMIYAKIPADMDSHSAFLSMPQRIQTPELSKDGHLQVYDCKDFILVNAYVPFANFDLDGAVDFRKQWDIDFRELICELVKQKPVVICGDLNIVHTKNDTCEASLEQNRPCFTSWERSNFNQLLADADLVDAYRSIYCDDKAVTFYGNYRGTNVGNRIDYFLISRFLLPSLATSDILLGFGTGQSVPIVLDFNPGVSALPPRFRVSSRRLDRPASIPNTSEEKTISIKDAARWLASMAATDGVISPSERKLLKEFALHFDLDPTSLYRMAHAIAKNVEVPEVEAVNIQEMKGRQFEDFVVSLCSDKSRFKLLAWRGDKISANTYAIENLLPDLHLRHRLDAGEVEYLVECKYRSSWGEDGIDLSSQYVRYHNAAKDRNVELFIALGVGGTPSNPNELFLVPGRMVKLDKKIDRARFVKCLCSKDPDGFHAYLNHYFNKRVFKTI